MKTVPNKTLGFVLNVEVPATIDEALKVFGSEEDVVDVINAQELYHGWNSVFADKFCTALEQSSGVKRRVSRSIPAVMDGEKVVTKQKDFLETPTEFVKNVIEVTKKPLADWEPLANEIAGQVKYGEGGGTSGGGRIGKTFLDTADLILKGESALLVVDKLKEFNPNINIIIDAETGLPNRDSLARALKVDQANQAAAAKARLGIS